MSEFDKCMVCKCELEEYGIGNIEENGERAISQTEDELNICKNCIKRFKSLLDALEGEAA